MEENYIRLNCVVLPHVAAILRRLFRQKWLRFKNYNWEGTKEDGEIFGLNSGKQVLYGTSQRQKKLLFSGDVQQWDVKIMCHVLRKMDFGKENCTALEKKHLELICNARHEIVHCPNQVFPDVDFKRICECLQESLKYLNLEFIALVLINMKITAPIDRFQLPSINDHISKVQLYLKNGQFKKAVDFCSSRLFIMPNYESDSVLIFLILRSQCYLSLAQATSVPDILELAKDDAKSAIIVNPNSTSAYKRLGEVYSVIGQKQKASKFVNIAEKLEKYILEAKKFKEEEDDEDDSALALGDARPAYSDLQSKEVLDVCNTLQTTKEIPTSLEEEDYIDISEEEMDKLEVEAYTKCASKGSAIGLYNLGIMHNEGRCGLKKDPIAATKLFQEAASKPAVTNRVTNVYVAKAEHALALNYENGLGGLKMNKQKAVLLFTRALEHGHTLSCNNLGYLYYLGKGIERNFEEAVRYWRIGASRGNFDAMQSLANFYLTEGQDPEKALIWHEEAIKAGNVQAQSLNEEFMVSVNKLKQSNQIRFPIEEENGTSESQLAMNSKQSLEKDGKAEKVNRRNQKKV